MNDVPNEQPVNEQTPEVTPEQNVTIKKDAPPANAGPGFVTVGDGLGKTVKVKVANIRATIEELLSDPKVAEFAKGTKERLRVVRRDSE